MSTNHLHSVDAPTPLTAPTASGLPDFEGQAVDFTRMKLASVGALEAGDAPVRIDDTVRMYVEGRVVRVDHVVDPKTGQLARLHTVKVVDAITLPWDFDAGQFEG